jgi:DNA repair protein RadC
VELVSLGTLNASLVHPREVYRRAIKTGAFALIIAHSHPSGDCEPSEDDISLTKRLVEAGSIIGVEILDHVIIGNTILSFKEKGLI